MNQASEEITTAEALSRVQRRCVAAVWWHEAKCAVRPVRVVVEVVDAEHVLKVAAAEDAGARRSRERLLQLGPVGAGNSDRSPCSGSH